MEPIKATKSELLLAKEFYEWTYPIIERECRINKAWNGNRPTFEQATLDQKNTCILCARWVQLKWKRCN